MADAPDKALDELNSALEQMDAPGAAPAAQQEEVATETPTTEKAAESDVVEGVEVGGRFWTSSEDLDKHYRSLQSRSARAEKTLAEREAEIQKLSELKKYQDPQYADAIEMAEYFKANPAIHEKVKDFFHSVLSGGETPKQAIKSSGLSKQDPEVKRLLEWQAQIEQERQETQNAEADRVLEGEIDDLKKSYKLDNEKIDQVLETAYKFNKNLDNLDDWVPLKDIYLMLSSKHAWRKAANVKDTAMPSPRSETIVPTSPQKTRTPEDSLLSSLDKMGL